MFANFFFFNDTATTEIYTLSLHDALPISTQSFALKLDPRSKVTPADLAAQFAFLKQLRDTVNAVTTAIITIRNRSEEHTSELQSPCNLVCRLLLEKKK